MIMLAVPVIPHHHHADGMICMKHDVTPEAQCPAHNHHHENDSCCSNECLARFSSPVPNVQTDLGPQHVFIAILFTDFIIENLLRPQERQLTNEYVYRESLHGTNIYPCLCASRPSVYIRLIRQCSYYVVCKSVAPASLYFCRVNCDEFTKENH